MKHGLLLAIAAATLVYTSFACSSQGGGNQDTPDGGEGRGTCVAGVDKSVGFDTAIPLAVGEKLSDYICPRGDQDFYKFEVKPGDRLVRISLSHSATITAVNLNYALFGANQKFVAGGKPNASNRFDAVHCLAPGTYYLVVQDSGDDAADGKMPYALSISTLPDKDASEAGAGNDTQELSQTLSGTATGYISCVGDADYYKVSAGTDQLLEVSLKAAKLSVVDLEYTIYDEAKAVVSTGNIPDGMKSSAALTVVHAVPKAGTYYIAVRDLGNDDSDPDTAYTLKVTPVAELDAQDKGQRNDSPATATVVGTYQNGAALERTFTGQIGSKGDVDFFVINGLAGYSTDIPAVMEVTLDFEAGTVPIDPSFSYLYPHAGSPCTKDSCCNALNTLPCNGGGDCLRETYTCVPRGDIFCQDASCVQSPALTCAQERHCAGAALCLPSPKLCAAEQVARWLNNKTSASRVTTSQLLIHGGPWYVRVGDLQNDEYEHGRNYTVTIKVRVDPDGAKELDSEYFPDLCFLVENPSVKDKVLDLHVEQAKKKGKKIALGESVTGFISYEGDRDYYYMDNPCPNADCTLRIEYSAGPGCPTSGAPRRWCENASENLDSLGLEFQYTMNFEDGKGWTGFRAKAGASGSWGAGGTENVCMYSYKGNGAGGYLFMVEDYNYNSWSWTCSYTFTVVKVADGCQPPCKPNATSGNCDV